PGLTRMTPGVDWDTFCQKTLNDGLDVIRKSPNATVILAESWRFQIDLAAEIGGSPLVKNHDRTTSFFILDKHLDQLRLEIGKRRLILVGEAPGAGISDTVGCFLRPKYLGFDCNKILSTPEADNSAKVVNLFLKKYAQKHENVLFIDPFDALCDGLRCHAILDGRVVYSDNYHLSKFGSRFMAKFMMPTILKPAVPDKSSNSNL
ncbi:MAG: SGNH hydrolase domain-containing protein, partial [Burkholderiaceae bacterium]